MLDFDSLVKQIDDRSEYERRISRLKVMGFQTNNIEETVEKSVLNIKSGYDSFVIYGEPQCGKTELMIALSAKLIDEGKKIIIVLLNDDTDLLNQNLQRFRESAINPTPVNYTEVLMDNIGTRKWIIFCKKNAKDLFKLNNALNNISGKIIIDDEGDYASPNGKVNKADQTKINELIGKLIQNKGVYIGVTATPARLDLNNTFQNLTEHWVKFKPHENYVGKEEFFPVNGSEELKFTLRKLPETGDKPVYIRKAVAHFIVNSSILNSIGRLPGNYSFLIHTSGEVDEHSRDRQDVISYFEGLIEKQNKNHKKHWEEILSIVGEKCVDEASATEVFSYAYQNISNQSVSIINSKNKNNVGVDTNSPSSVFSVFIGGNKVSRGITFGNLLGMFFTRDAQKIQQDTYIQRARMFGNRKKYLKYFELWITEQLYNDWRRCFMYHYLSLMSIDTNGSAPVWIGDQRIQPVATQSIDKRTLLLEKGEMVFPKFSYSKEIQRIIYQTKNREELLKKMQEYLGNELFPRYVYDFIVTNSRTINSDVNILAPRFISDNTDYHEELYRKRGLFGGKELSQYGIHKLMMVYNSANEARLIYYFDGKANFFKNSRGAGK